MAFSVFVCWLQNNPLYRDCQSLRGWEGSEGRGKTGSDPIYLTLESWQTIDAMLEEEDKILSGLIRVKKISR